MKWWLFLVPRRSLHLRLNVQVENVQVQSQEARCLLVTNEVNVVLYKVNSNREYECMINELVDLRNSRITCNGNRVTEDKILIGAYTLHDYCFLKVVAKSQNMFSPIFFHSVYTSITKQDVRLPGMVKMMADAGDRLGRTLSGTLGIRGVGVHSGEINILNKRQVKKRDTKEASSTYSRLVTQTSHLELLNTAGELA